MMLTRKRIHKLCALFVFVISTGVYLKTIAPTTSYWDCGEFISCAYIFGVPHPPGTPLYILVGRIFSMIPFVQDIGLRVNVISALVSGVTIMLVYLIIVQLVQILQRKLNKNIDYLVLYSSGIIGSLVFAFTDTFWFNAVEAEVYASSTFFTAIVIWLIFMWYDNADNERGDKYIFILAYCIGLAIGVHLLNILALPAIGLIIYFRKFKFSWRTFLISNALVALVFITIYPGIVKWLPIMAYRYSNWLLVLVVAGPVAGIYYAVKKRNRILMIVLTSFFLVIMGVSTYVAIYIRSNLNPVIDMNNPENMENMVRYLNREQYGDWGYIERRAPLWEYQIKKMYIRYFGWQFIGKGTTLDANYRIIENISINGLWALPFLIGIIGMYYHFKNDRRHASAILILFLITGLAIVMYLNQDDPQPRERDYVYTGSFLAFAFWIGVGIHAVLEWISIKIPHKHNMQKPVTIAAILLLTIVLPINTIAFNYKSHDRSGNYVAFDYSYNILQSCEPNAILFTNGDNDTYPLWFLQTVNKIRPDVRVVNLSLLNTAWHIKQLKHEYPKVPMTYTDQQIDQLRPVILPEDRRTVRFPVPKRAYERDKHEVLNRKSLSASVDINPAITFELKPTLLDKAIRVQDIMVLNIIQANQFERPIYFTLTTSQENMLNMFDYLRMDGLTYKLVTYPGDFLSASRLKENLLEKFQYRGLNDSTVYFDENTKGLLGNYQSAFLNLAQYYNNEKMPDTSIEILDKLNEVMPDTVIPMRDQVTYFMGVCYYRAGRKDEFRNRIDKLIHKKNVSIDDKLKYAGVYANIFNEKEKAESLVREIIGKQPNNVKAYSWLINFYSHEKMYVKGLDLLNSWLDNHPNDKVALEQVNYFKKQVEN